MPKPTTTKPAPSLSLTVQYASDDDAAQLPTRTQLRRWLRAALAAPAAPAAPACDAEVTIRFVGTEEGRQLNREYRGRGYPDKTQKDYATNVLSFPYSPPPQLCGDLVLCLPVIVQEAAEQQKELRDHLAHLVIHGALHLQGHDHETDDEARRMEDREREILKRFRITDPYAT